MGHASKGRYRDLSRRCLALAPVSYWPHQLLCDPRTFGLDAISSRGTSKRLAAEGCGVRRHISSLVDDVLWSSRSNVAEPAIVRLCDDGHHHDAAYDIASRQIVQLGA